MRLSAEAGLSGISVEDATLPDGGAYDFDHAVEWTFRAFVPFQVLF
ncbi:MAG: hypothetical protein AB8B85_22690 [Paracoccaceae bacterium]